MCRILQLLLAITFLVAWPTAESQWLSHRPVTPPPLCTSQFALANQACGSLPFTPVPPPSPPVSPVPLPESSTRGSGNRRWQRHGHRRNHHHRHGHRHEHEESPNEEQCCRWLKDIDDVCVCELLVHLPPFLTRPVHNYTVVVDHSCTVTFQCSSRLVRSDTSH